ncbi:MAG: PKD domain-containing protein, partial [Candidatus Methanomethylophilaceae archaeon]|nr:PKD domain-containing protein [Candidatus Methanomethylophilaceae archaeon]
MMKRILSLVVLIVLAALLPAAAAADTETGDASPDSLEIGDGANNRLLGLGFIPNVGQYDPVVDYVLQYQGTTVFFMRDGLVLAHTAGSAENVSRDVIRQSFAGASPETHLAARDQRAGVVNYYVGNDSSKWLSGIPVYSEVVYEDLYPGIDLVYAEKNGRLKREFRISPGADPSRIELIYGGERAPRVDADGVLRFASLGGEMLESPLVCWQVIGGKRVDRAAEYVVDDGSVRIGVAEYDAGYELIIDPELVYSSYLGGGEGDYGYALAGDGDGGVWITGYTASPDFPVLDDSDGKSGHIAFVSHFSSSGTLLSSTCLGGARSPGGTRSDYGHVLAGDEEGGVWVMGTTGPDFPVLNASQSAYGGSGDVFVSHFSSSGTLLSSTYLGGGGIELDNALVGDGDGGVWVAGLTTSTDLPVTEDAYQSTYGGGYGDAFVSHFSSTGALLSSTYLGGENYDYGSALAGDGAGGVWVMGGNQYGGFPVLNEYQRTNSGGWDVFVSHFSSSGTHLSSTYLGGSDHDDGSALVGDGDGGVWVTGETRSLYVPDSSKGFPVRNASQRTNGGYFDAFVSHLSSEGALLSSTYLGGDEHDSGYALAGDGDGGVWVTGRTRSADFPVRNAHQSAYGGGFSYGDRFVSHFSSEGALLSSTYLGGEADDYDGDIGREDGHRYTLVGDDAGGVWVTGSTASTAFPVLDEYQSTNGGGWDAFVSHFASDGALLLSTYLGGDGDDYGRALAGDGDGGVWVTGYTGSPGFPVLNAYQSSYGGSSDVFVARFGIDDPVPVHPPTANFTANATSGTAPLTVQFTDLSTGDPTTWFWDFGDGATSTKRHPVHTYTAPGTYTVSLTVTSAGGSNTMTKMRHVTVTSAVQIGAVQIGLGDVGAAKGQTTRASLIIHNASAIGAGSLDLTYDPAVVTVDAVHFASPWSGASNINNTNGKARLAYYSSSGYGQSGDISICTVTLRATGEPGDISP